MSRVPEMREDDVPAYAMELEARIAELEAALTTAQRRFELLAVVSDAMVNGVKPSVGAAEIDELRRRGPTCRDQWQLADKERCGER